MSVVVSVEDAGPSRKQLTIEVPAPAVDAEMQRVITAFSREIQLPGFRRGKAPKQLLLKRFREEIEKEVVDRLLPRYWHQAESEAGIDSLLNPQVDDVQLKPDEPLVFKASVDVRPEIELGDIDGIKLPDPSIEVTDEEVDEMVEDLRRRQGDWVPVERSAAQGDLVSLEISEVKDDDAEKTEDDEAASEPDTVAVEVGDPNVWEELSLAVTGLREGQESTFSRTAEVEGESVERNFRFQVTAVKERELPEVDDELAQSVGGFDSVDEMRQEIRHRMFHNKERGRFEERETALLERLREMHPLDLPEQVVGRETERLLRNYAQRLASQGVDLETVDIDWVKMRDDMVGRAREGVHARLVLDAIAKDRGMEATEQELEAALSDIARSQQASTAAVRQALAEDGRLAELRGQLAQEKVVRRLIGAEEAEEEAAEEGQPETEAA
ncbi:MAG: trigger factor, partial [Acidobacteriota bacterium]|nr:trigger factor [Acidobacteriota bacterium]